MAPSQQAQGTVQPGDPAEIIENTFSLDNFVAYAVAKENKPLIDALNSGLDAVIADGTWSRLYSDWVPRELPPGWKPGSKAAPPPQLPDFAAIAASHQQAASPDSTAPQPKSALSQLADSFLDWELYKQAIPDLFKTGLPNTLILTVSASVIGLVLGIALSVAGISRARWLRWPARVSLLLPSLWWPTSASCSRWAATSTRRRATCHRLWPPACSTGAHRSADPSGQLHRRPAAQGQARRAGGSTRAREPRVDPGDDLMATQPQPVSLTGKEIHLAFGPTAATSCWMAGRCYGTTPTGCGNESAWCSSISTCSRTAPCWTT